MADEGTSTVAAVAESPPSGQPEAQEPAAPKIDPNERRLAHMARQQKQLAMRSAKLAQEREALAKERAEYEQHKAWKQRITQGDYDALQDLGLTKDQLAQYLINQPTPEARAVAELNMKLQKIEENQGTIQKTIEEREQANYQQALQAIKAEAAAEAKSDGDKYELINANFDDAIDAATQLVEEVWKSEGRIITVQEALNDVEEYYLDAILSSATKSKKIQAKLMPKPAEAAPPVKDTSGKPSFTTAVRDAIAQKQAPVRTLTHQQIPMPTDKALSAKDRKQRAILAFQGKLNS